MNELMNDLALLRRYEPVVRYTKGEMFFPTVVDGYLRVCRLWMADDERKTTLLADQGTLTTEKLAEFRSVPIDHRLYLQFTTRPLQALEYQRWLRQPNRPKFSHPNRLYRVSLLTRVIDSLFDVALLLRGRVPGGTAAAAQVLYAGLNAEEIRPTYYARVIRDGGYIALHYIYFFVMNDWRSSFHGVNDHESDWEQVFVYLVEGSVEGEGSKDHRFDTSPEGASLLDEAFDDSSTKREAEPIPLWFACASHDFSGDDLRRRWDDPEIEKVAETHPVIYAGAGSHGSYFSRGEYLMQEEPGFLKPLLNFSKGLERFWRDTLRQGTPLNLDAGLRAIFSIPFVDYARGDGRQIGFGGDSPWSLVQISDADGWVHNYRGLWGLDTWDPLGGERAPSGPKYDRNGSVRLSWSNPLAWAGLDKVSPPRQAVTDMERFLVELEDDEKEIIAKLNEQRLKVRKLELEVEALRQTAFMTTLHERRQVDLVAAESELQNLRRQHNEILESQEASRMSLEKMRLGDFGGPRDHIQKAHYPEAPIENIGRFAHWWAAVSGGVILLLIIPLVYLRPANWPLWLIGIAVLFGAVDALTRGKLDTFLLRLAITLALLTSAILLWQFWWLLLIVAFMLVVIIGIRDNLREMSRT